MEQEEYTKDAIDWSYIEFVDNQDVLDLIEKKPGGIVALLDEACIFQNQRTKHLQTSYIRLLRPTRGSSNQNSLEQILQLPIMLEKFCRLYQSELFLDKNKDYVIPEHQDLLGASKCPFVVGFFPPLLKVFIHWLSF
uniref:Myosin-9 n=1 Tax=Noccaea caerulescens TaxID=107243 RepID=A0A1J3J6P7_NOCCA